MPTQLYNKYGVFFTSCVVCPPHPIAKLQADEDGQGAAGS